CQPMSMERRRRAVAASVRLLDELGVDLDLHVLADQQPARLEGLVPAQAEVLPIELAGRADATDRAAERRLDGGTRRRNVEGDRFRHAVDGEVAGELVGGAGRL